MPDSQSAILSNSPTANYAMPAASSIPAPSPTQTPPSPQSPASPNSGAPINQNLFAIPGETLDQYETRLGAMNEAGPGTGFGTPVPAQPVTDLATAHDEVAKQLGFSSYQDALDKLGAPSEDTTKFYNDAYTAAGLDALQTQINQKNSDLNGALGKINDNPWLDEASRVGRSRTLQTLAQGDIKNLQDEYNTKLKGVQTLVSNHTKDVTATDAQNKAKLALLESQAKALAAQSTTQQKQATVPPKTIKGPNGSTFQWNPKTNSFDPLFGPSSAGTKPVKSGNLSLQPSDISQGQQILEASRGKDGYANTATYTNMMNHWTSSQGLLQDFIKQYPPKNYLNPKDPTVPSPLKPYIKSTALNLPNSQNAALADASTGRIINGTTKNTSFVRPKGDTFTDDTGTGAPLQVNTKTPGVYGQGPGGKNYYIPPKPPQSVLT